MKKKIVRAIIIIVMVIFSNGCSERVNEESTTSKDKEMIWKYGEFNNANVYEMSEEIKAENTIFSNLEIVSKGKTLPKDILKSDMNYSEDNKIDENGTLLGGESYFFINITVENKSQNTENINLACCSVIELNENNESMYGFTELRYISNHVLDETSKDYYNHELKPNEKQTIEIGYIIEDSMLISKSLYFQIDSDGGGTNLKFFKINM